MLTWITLEYEIVGSKSKREKGVKFVEKGNIGKLL